MISLIDCPIIFLLWDSEGRGNYSACISKDKGFPSASWSGPCSLRTFFNSYNSRIIFLKSCLVSWSIWLDLLFLFLERMDDGSLTSFDLLVSSYECVCCQECIDSSPVSWESWEWDCWIYVRLLRELLWSNWLWLRISHVGVSSHFSSHGLYWAIKFIYWS